MLLITKEYLVVPPQYKNCSKLFPRANKRASDKRVVTSDFGCHNDIYHKFAYHDIYNAVKKL